MIYTKIKSLLRKKYSKYKKFLRVIKIMAKIICFSPKFFLHYTMILIELFNITTFSLHLTLYCLY